ncbi:MAG: heavy metal translocating P-type ATPase [Gammaproteobacteria bacterium]|nr:heavy metal translocating P-type ATPase [Gammaproteobacteria bacterium]
MTQSHALARVEQCFHCGLELPPPDEIQHAQIDGQQRDFCCLGCRSVCEAIYDAGMEGFYQRTPDGLLLSPPPEPPRDIGLYDLEEVQEEFVHEMGAVREINLLVEGIHCAACVWLIENTLGKIPGVLGIHVNLAGRRLLLRWNNEQVKLSQLIERLGQIGYVAAPFDPEAAEGAIKRRNRAMLYRMAFAGFTMMNLMWISIALYTGAADDEFRHLFHIMGFVLATPTLFYSGWLFFKGAYTGLRNWHLSMDLPIAIGATVTWAYSSYITFTKSTFGDVYFDTVVNFIFIILVGRYLEAMSRRAALTATQRLLDLQPRVATTLIDGVEKVVPIRSVKAEQMVLVKAGYKVPVDGVVVEGASSIDESMLSGESAPVNKKPGDAVSAGTLNTSSALLVRVTRTLRETSLGKIIALVEEAQASKAPIQCMADRIVPWFVLATLSLASITFAWWVGSDFELALMAATSVLIITCPCAFGMATPMSMAVASGQGARFGIMVKNSAVLETFSKVTHIVFDKTGTLTTGKMTVQQILAQPGWDEQSLLRLAAGAERYSEHSIGQAIVASAQAAHIDVEAIQPEGFENRPGHGIAATIEGRAVLLGKAALLQEQGIAIDTSLQPRIDELERQAFSCVFISVDGQFAGLMAIADQLRADARELVAQLRQDGVRMTLLSGDRRQVAEAVAEQLGGMRVIAEVLPQDKDQVIAELQAQGERVAMVGDGINDAPALIRADVGIAVGSGTDVSVESADIVLMGDELIKVRLASALSRRTLRTIRQNIGISFTYNAIMVPLAMMAFVTPLVAAISMPISSLLVIGNAARIRTLFKGIRPSR